MFDFFIMALGSFILLNLTYFICIKKNNFGLIDIAWGVGFVVISSIGLLIKDSPSDREFYLFGMTFIWGLRLSSYLILRNFNKPEDFRYKEMRERWGKNANVNAYYRIFILQFFLMQIVALPIYSVHFQAREKLSFVQISGIIFWVIGFLWETIADFQKSKFKKNPENREKLCQIGLWKFSRHPNYFGETLCWWGAGLLSFTPDYPWGLLGSIFINLLLLYVTGVPFLEKKHIHHKDFEEYKKTTPRFFPDLSKLIKRG